MFAQSLNFMTDFRTVDKTQVQGDFLDPHVDLRGEGDGAILYFFWVHTVLWLFILEYFFLSVVYKHICLSRVYPLCLFFTPWDVPHSDTLPQRLDTLHISPSELRSTLFSESRSTISFFQCFYILRSEWISSLFTKSRLTISFVQSLFT